MFYRVMRLVVRIYLSRVPLQVEGLEHIPVRGSAVIAGNHPSAVDHLLIMIALGRPYCGLMRAENFRNALVAWWLRGTRVFPVSESGDNSHSLHMIEQEIRRGCLYLTAPEGDVSVDAAVGPFRGGFVSLAAKSGVPVIPVAIFGTQRILREPRRPHAWRDFVPRPAPSRLAFLEPIYPQRNPSSEEKRQCAEAVREAIIRKLMQWQTG
jgi:1-acyl-sn-glycerol-3-phosphate acyltransferase